MSDRKKRAISGIIAGTGGALVVQLATIIVTPFYLDLTSQELFGLWLTLLAILGWIKIGDMGLGMALTKRSVEALESSDYELLLRLAYGAMLPAFIFSIFFAGIGYILTDTLILTFNINSILEDEFKTTYYLLLVIATFRPAFGVFGSLIDGKQHIAFLGVRNTVVSLLTTAVTLLFLYLNFGIISFAYGLLFEALVIPFIDIIYLLIVDKKVRFFPIKTSKKEVVALLEFGGPFQILKLTNIVSTNVDNLIIASLIGLASVPIYVFTGKLAFVSAIFLIGIIPSMLFPGVAQLFELGDFKRIQSVYLKLSNIAIRIGLLTGVVYLTINEAFIDIWVGSDNFGGVELTSIFVVWIIFESFVRGITIIIYSSGKLKSLAIVSCIEAIINICLTLMLIKHIGILGAVLASVLSRLVSVFYIPIKINTILNLEHSRYLSELIVGSIFRSLPMIFIASVILGFVYLNDITFTIFEATITASIFICINAISFEGAFLLGLKGVSLVERLKLLKSHYLRV
jgi:O-antigen/teichoic acid export membrane protein